MALLERRKRTSLFQELFRLARLLDEAAVARVGEAGAPTLRTSHTALLPHLDLEGTRLVDLAARMGISKQAVGQLVDDLESMGVVERAPDPEDGRARRVRFTRRGFQAVLHGLGVLDGLERELAVAIGRTAVERLREDVGTALRAVESGALAREAPTRPPARRR
ncbi:MAG TPA: helix-turn-helix domain-containing protein [Myxococcaceae bacterium]|nr:helix-turn-helix domain-containing protein [Myxococcaceae bacterium]